MTASDSEEKKVKGSKRREASEPRRRGASEEKLHNKARRAESERRGAGQKRKAEAQEARRRGASEEKAAKEPKRRGAGSEDKDTERKETADRGKGGPGHKSRGPSVASSASQTSLSNYSHKCRHCGTWCCGEFGLTQHQETSKKCMQYKFYGMGHSWSDAGLRAHKQWKKNQQWQGTSQHHQQEVKPSRSSWILKENKDYPSHSAEGREPHKKRSLEPPKPKSPESQQKLSGLEKTKDKAKVAEKPKPAAEKRAAKAADDELSSEYEYVTETESTPEMAVPKKPKPPCKAQATSSAAPKASAPKAPGPVAPTASGPSAGPNGLSAIADFYQSQANFLRTVGRH